MPALAACREAACCLDGLRVTGARRRGGGQSADHVDVLSHIDVLRDLVIIATGGLRVRRPPALLAPLARADRCVAAAGHGADLGDKIETNIREIAAGIPMRPS